MLNATNANAANNLAQCVQVTSSSVTASSLNPQYVVTIKDACDTDLGSVTIQFYSGSNDIRSATRHKDKSISPLPLGWSCDVYEMCMN